MKTALAALLPLCSFAVPAIAGESTEAASVAQAFYAKFLELRPAGLPDVAQQKALAPYLSKRLLALMDGARAYQEQEARVHPDEKPPFVDGCLFASLFEGPKSFKVGTTVAEGTASKVKVHFTAGEGVAWDDEAIVVEEDGRHVIDDVILAGIGPFNPPGRLSTNLESR